MPNWVSNTITVIGETPQDIAEFQKAMSKPIPRMSDNGVPTETEPTEFSFWNIKAPEPEIWEEYFTVSSGGGKTPNNWYDWNNRNWGTKWDAGSVYTEANDNEMSISFETAWSPVEQIVDILSLQFRHLSFHYSYEEENGWGGEATYEAGESRDKSEYDEPNSHADYTERGRVEDCACGWNSEPEEWYDDCPREGAEK